MKIYPVVLVFGLHDGILLFTAHDAKGKLHKIRLLGTGEYVWLRKDFFIVTEDYHVEGDV